MSLLARNPERLDQMSNGGEQTLRQSLMQSPEEYEAVRGPDDPPTLLEWVEQNAPALLGSFGKRALPGVITHQRTGDAIVQMKWCVVRLPPDAFDMLTCDRPVYMSHGVMDANCDIARPIAPRRVFFATRRPSLFEGTHAREIPDGDGFGAQFTQEQHSHQSEGA